MLLTTQSSYKERVTFQRHRKDGGREIKEGEALTAKLDNNERLADFVQKLEGACVGKMTDQGSCHSNPRTQLLKMDKICFGSMEAFGGQETDQSLGLKAVEQLMKTSITSSKEDWTRHFSIGLLIGLLAKLDNNERLADLVQKLESACVERDRKNDRPRILPYSNPLTQGQVR
ncbi:hypothetical protein QVD17_20167 [Tagetes erecta]|uniref:Uncharacterized protein n=1 Tax=Tagetes erecta TaxID=13708 RepID=A0AAD8KKT5_TARER|nr:hypothetical protein QVD17_20167 [Tagetes erecta]